MGLITSSESGPGQSILESFGKEQLLKAFRTRSLTLLREIEVKALTTKLNITNLAPTVLTPSDLAQLLQLPTENVSDDHKIHKAIKTLYDSFRVLGHFPFLQDSLSSDQQLTLDDLIITSLFHTGRYRKILAPGYDYLKLVFLSLALTNSLPKVQPEQADAKLKQQVEETFVEAGLEAHVLQLLQPLSDEDTPERVSRLIMWSSFDVIKNYDDIGTDGLSIKASDLLQLITLFLILNSIPKKAHDLMTRHLIKNIGRWAEFEAYALIILRYINVNITSNNLEAIDISFEEFHTGFNNSIPHFIPQTFQHIFVKGLLSSVQPTIDKNIDAEEEEEDEKDEDKSPQKKKHSFPKFRESRLINDASIAYVSALVKSLGPEIELSSQNLVKLYSGSESGFSIRSLESKIFKWQAPTLFIVSGKRLKNKTITTNKRYEQFNAEFPRHFRSSENSKKDWQDDNDKITYAVLVSQPWRNSNKRNFGDSNSIIISISPRMDFYKSVNSQALSGESIYFNNLGLGLGFGNSQPLNKGGVKKFLPGDVSLTVEANLEFAVFRHLAGLKSNSSTFFKGSTQRQVQSEDFEDRFMITDLEVWGVGSTKELEEQRKQWEWEEKQAEARQGVNLKNLGEERAFLEMVGLVGNHNSSGGSV